MNFTIPTLPDLPPITIDARAIPSVIHLPPTGCPGVPFYKNLPPLNFGRFVKETDYRFRIPPDEFVQQVIPERIEVKWGSPPKVFINIGNPPPVNIEITAFDIPSVIKIN